MELTKNEILIKDLKKKKRGELIARKSRLISSPVLGELAGINDRVPISTILSALNDAILNTI